MPFDGKKILKLPEIYKSSAVLLDTIGKFRKLVGICDSE
jgi:hypothetical protein